MNSIGAAIRGIGAVSGEADGTSSSYVDNNAAGAIDNSSEVESQSQAHLELHGVAPADTKNDILKSKSKSAKK